ncbi:hypothetical protein EWH99_10775 [Sporolactobacillus sp. THM7-7]|nr:hypothetical protein EWH99_10775 [Sporolactobacillus sp. THM7-7]
MPGLNSSGRVKYLDVAKGILIILVVLGHSGLDQDISIARDVFWFHMPAFFIISGYLFHSYTNNFGKWSLRKTKKFMIPYIAYCLCITVVLNYNHLLEIPKQLLKLAYSGRAVEWVYWFIPCLLLTELLFGILITKFKNQSVFVILLFMFILAQIESQFYIPFDSNYFDWPIYYKFPWNIDVVLISSVYFALGFYSRNVINKIGQKINMLWFIVLSVSCLALIILNYFNIFNYSLDLKLSHYNHFILDLVIPYIYTIWILMLSKLLSSLRIFNILAYAGFYSLPIMYLHIPVNVALMSRLEYGSVVFIIFGTILPLIFAYICSKSSKLGYFFLGMMPKKLPEQSIEKHLG